ncbi:hypothetical protein [Niallia circulans]|uniref:Uncharacterized protein n=1 Tax=Niallia circulans TaxID=1397 RepID=A0A941GK04_NIACI|nr:hypothetical protein [Niallia circulans]MCB5239568.1 hypothetical protein [Niallia circulans]
MKTKKAPAQRKSGVHKGDENQEKHQHKEKAAFTKDKKTKKQRHKEKSVHQKNKSRKSY